MRKYFLFTVLCASSLFSYSQDKASLVEPFLQEIVSQFPAVRDIAVSPLENEIYFTIQSFQNELSAIVFCKKLNGSWSSPKVVSFSGKYHDLEPFISADGLKLFFASDRPLNASKTEAKDYDIWFVERKDVNSKWSKPINLGAPVNSNNNEFYPSVAINKTIYFTSDADAAKNKDEIFCSKWVNGKYEPPQALSDSINSNGYEFNAFIAPDESFLLYTCYNRKDGSGSGDLYISFRNEKGEWTSAKNLGDTINSAQMDYCPFVNLKSNVLYFTSKRSSINGQFTTIKTITELLKEMNKYENSQSRLYQVAFNPLHFKK